MLRSIESCDGTYTRRRHVGSNGSGQKRCMGAWLAMDSRRNPNFEPIGRTILILPVEFLFGTVFGKTSTNGYLILPLKYP